MDGPVQPRADDDPRIGRLLRAQPVRRAPNIPHTSEAHPLVANYQRARYGPPHVWQLDVTRPRHPRPREG